jgi:ABC-2 type transport system permease protein
VLCSSITESQIIALLLSLVVTLFLYGLDWILPFFPSGIITSTFEYISTGYHFANIKRGVIDTRDLVYYFSMIGLSLLIASVMLEKRKW